MSDQSRVALIATRGGPARRAAEYHAVIIGTTFEGGKENWRYICYRLASLRTMLADVRERGERIDPFSDDTAKSYRGFWLAPGDAHPLPSIPTGGALSAGEAAEFKTASGSDLPPITASQVSLVFRDIVEVRHYRAGASPFEPPAKDVPPAQHDCLARLDTCRAVDGDKDAKPVPIRPDVVPAPASPELMRRKAGSMIQLTAFKTDGPNPPRGKINGFRALLDVRLILNGHERAPAARPERGDTRGRFVFLATQKTGSRSLWKIDTANHDAIPDHGALFDRIWMGLSDNVKPSGETVWSLSYWQDKTLVDLAGLDKADRYPARYVSPANSNAYDIVNFVPLLSQLKLPMSNLSVQRQLGFRSVAFDNKDKEDYLHYPRLALRFELLVLSYGTELSPAIDGILPADAKISQAFNVYFAQEQRRGDIGMAIDPEAPVRWIGSARVDSLEDGTTAGSIARVVLDGANALVERLHLALRAVRDGGPMSLLPVADISTLVDVTSPANARPIAWHAVGILVDSVAHERDAAYAGTDSIHSARDTRFNFASFEPRAVDDMWPAALTKYADPNKRLQVKFDGELRRLQTEDRKFASFNFVIGAPRYVAGDTPSDSNPMAFPALQAAVSVFDDPDDIPLGTRFELNAVGLKTPARRAVSIGALRLVFDDKSHGDLIQDAAGFVLIRRYMPQEEAKLEGMLDAGIDAIISLPVEKAEPADQDDPPSAQRITARDRRAKPLNPQIPDYYAPLLIPLPAKPKAATPATSGGPAAAGAVSYLTLTAAETATRHRDHTVALSLRSVSTKSDAGPQDNAPVAPSEPTQVLVLDPRPFRVAAVEYSPLTAAATSESNQIAVWNAAGEGGLSWRIRDDGETVRMVLPPQVIGEAMEKNRSGRPGKPADIEPFKPAAARFGSLTEVHLDPTFAVTRFREPGWNLRRILGQATQRSPGARLRGMRTEFLYGMLTRIRTPDVWYSEIAGAMGDPALPLFDVFDNSKRHLKRHAELIEGVLTTERSRIAVDKLWKSRPDDDPVLEEGVSFELRLRDLDNKGKVLLGPATALRWPVQGDVPVAGDTGGLIKADVLKKTFLRSDDDRRSFAGGLAWAFESANILMSVYGNPRADGGRIRGVHLSAYGGYASQRALFDSRRTIIETETTQGRVQRYRLERIGRISCLWNRAKHVIVYERTVVPPAQFYNEEPIGLRQDEHVGRPVLRKVEEYVEILQPIRRYPEDGHSVCACGFLVGAEFKSKKIRVDSDWGNDVRREGWRVPLWNKAFLGLPNAPAGQPRNPDSPANLYPKPQINVIVMNESGVERPREIASPEKLYFYTSVVPGEGEDTDAWQSVRHVDFSDSPTLVVGTLAPQSADLTDAPLPPEPEYIPGYEPFTIDLVETEDAVALTHGRVAGGPNAILRNVTIARAGPAASGDSKSGSNAARTKALGEGLALTAANVRNELDRAVGRVLGALEKADRATTGAAIQQQIQPLIDKAFADLDISALKGKIGDVAKVLEGVGQIDVSKACAGLEASVRAQIDGQIGRFRIVAQDLVTSAAGEIEKRVMAAGRAVDSEIARFERIEALAGAMVERVPALGHLPDEEAARLKRYLTATVADIRDNILKELATAQKRVQDVEASIENLRLDVAAEIRALRSQIKANAKDVSTTIAGDAAAVTGKVNTVANDVIARLDKFNTDLQGIGDGKLIAEAKATIDTTAADLAHLRGQIGEVAASDLPPAARRILAAAGNALDIAIEFARRAAADAAAGANILIGTLRADLAKARAAFETLQQAVNTRIGLASTTTNSALDKLVGALNALLDPVEQQADNLTKALESVRSQLLTELKAAESAMVAAFQVALQGLDATLVAAKQQIDAFASEVKQPLKTALDAFAKKAQDTLDKIKADLQPALDALKDAAKSFETQLISETERVKGGLISDIDRAATAVSVPAQDLITQLRATCDKLEGFAKEIAEDAKKAGDWIKRSLDLDKYKQDLKKEIDGIIQQGADTVDQLKARIADKAHELTRDAENRARQLVGAVQESVRDVTGASLDEIGTRAEGIYQKGDNALRALRALGDPPKTDHMGFNRPEVAYVLGEAKKLGIDMTPALALVNRASDQIAAVEQAGKAVGELLDSFGARMPTSELADRILPQKLRQLSVADLLPDMAGIDFRGLLQRVGFPDLDDSEALKFRHGFDQATMTAWMEADIDVPFTEAVPIMEFGPVKIIVDTARFTSKARLAAGRDGTQKSMKGQIFGDWHVDCIGQSILTFRQTGLYFDETGHIDFKVQPDRVELAEILQFLSDLVEASGQTGDFTVAPFMRGMIPAGVAATLDLDLPDIQSGAFGISDLSIHILFGIAAIPEFEIFGELSVGSRLAPFSINVWILNGGGYLTQRLSFLPAARPRPVLTYVLDIAIVAGVGLGFSFGIVSGGVYLQVGCGIALTWTTGAGGNTTTVRVFILARGNVDVAGIITVGIALLLEISYDGANMIGAGELTLRIKISVFYTLNVNQRVEYAFAGESKKGAGSQADAYC